MLYPLIARRSCDDCRKYLYDDRPEGTHTIVERIPGEPEPRGAGPVPCDTDQGCPKGHYNDQRSLSARNRQAYAYHKMHRAAGRPLPDDPIVMRNAYLIEDSERRCQGVQREELLNTIRTAGMRVRALQ